MQIGVSTFKQNGAADLFFDIILFGTATTIKNIFHVKRHHQHPYHVRIMHQLVLECLSCEITCSNAAICTKQMEGVGGGWKDTVNTTRQRMRGWDST